MTNFRRSWSLFKSSLLLVKQDRKLVVLPLMSIIAVVVTAGAFLLAVWSVHPFVNDANNELGGSTEQSFTPATVALLVLGYLCITFVGMFFNIALVCAANDRLQGGTPTLRSALAGAMKHAGPIALWAIFSATISIAIRVASERVGLIGRIVVSLIGVAWSVATFFVIPIMIVEGVGVNEAFGRSKELMRKTWGEQIVGGAIVGLAMIPFWIVLVLVGWFARAFFGEIALLPVAIVFVLLVAFGNMISAVFSTVLYQYAKTGMAPVGFRTDYINESFKAKRSRRIFGRK
jgi:Family of unknown function (DUF6159)